MINILTNFDRLGLVSTEVEEENGVQLSLDLVPNINQRFRTLKIYQRLYKKHILILNVEEPLLFKICLLKYFLPWTRFKIISVDLILRAPRTSLQCLICRVKGLLLQKVDNLLLYHKDISGYQKYFGIDPEKCIYVPFKVNHFSEIQELLSKSFKGKDPTGGDYILAAGRSMRDLNTFVDAMGKTGIPGVLLRQERKILAQNATSLEYGNLPPNVREVVDHGTDRSFISYMAKARAIVIPRFQRDINATGIATYLMAMALKKCVIISHGPGVTDLLANDEAILVPPGDAIALSKAIERAWNDADYRQRIAVSGYNYALTLKGERRLMTDILKTSLYLHNKYIQSMY